MKEIPIKIIIDGEEFNDQDYVMPSKKRQMKSLLTYHITSEESHFEEYQQISFTNMDQPEPLTLHTNSNFMQIPQNKIFRESTKNQGDRQLVMIIFSLCLFPLMLKIRLSLQAY